MIYLSRRHRAALFIAAIAALWALAVAGLAGAATTATRVSNTYADAQSYMATLTAPVPQDGDGFGYSVAIDGASAVVARGGAMPVFTSSVGDMASRVTDSIATSDPSVHVFDKSAAGWSAPVTLSPPAGTIAEDLFSGPVAISEHTVVWGAPWRDGAFTDEGAAYVYTRSSGVWSSPVTVSPAGPVQRFGGQFGSAVAIDDDTLVVGIPGSAAAYVFTRSAGVWGTPATLTPDGWDGTQFGFGQNVDVSGDTIAVAWPQDAVGQGRVFLYQGSGATWSRVATIQPPPGAPDLVLLGTSMALDGDDLLAGTFAGLVPQNVSTRDWVPGSGLAYAFRRTGGVWDTGTTITAPVPEVGDNFGMTVAVDDGVALVSAGGFLAAGAPERGALMGLADKAHLFHLTDAGWTHDATLSVPATDTGFGASLALAGDSALVGAPAGGLPPISPARLPFPVGAPGAAYVFDLLGPNAAKGFKATSGYGKVTLSWSNPATDWAKTAIMRSTSGYVETMAGLRASRAAGVQAYNGTGTSFTNTGLTNGTMYYYSAFTQDPEGRFGPAAKASARAGVASGSERVILSLTTPGSPTEDERFCLSGTFGPTHYVGAKITLWFWYWNGKSWVLYPIRPSTTVGAGGRTWRVCLTLPYAGRWKVRAFHKDPWNSGVNSNTRSFFASRNTGDLW
jgi:hypothetical protein